MADVGTSTGTSYQNPNTYFFVPSSAGKDLASTSDDVNTPGAILRLGGYSDLEVGAVTAGTGSTFYPRQHRTDEGGNEATNAAGGGNGGILIAGSGRILIFAAEKMYVNSTGAMHIDTASTLAVKADSSITMTAGGVISMTSGTDQDITIDAGGSTGTISQKAKKTTTEVNGMDLKKITDNKFEWFQANSYVYQLGGDYKVSMGGRFAFWLGASLTINAAIDIKVTVITDITLYFTKFDIGLFKFDYAGMKFEIKEGDFIHSKWNFKFKAAKVETTAVAAVNDAVVAENEQVKARRESVGVEQGSVKALIALWENKIAQQNHM